MPTLNAPPAPPAWVSTRLRRRRFGEDADPGAVAAQVCQAGHQADADRIRRRAEDDRNAVGRLLRGHGRRRRRCIAQVGLARRLFGGQPGKGLLLVNGLGPVVGNSLPVDPAEHAHLIEEGLQCHHVVGGGAWHQYTDAAQACGGRLCLQQPRRAREGVTEREHDLSAMILHRVT